MGFQEGGSQFLIDEWCRIFFENYKNAITGADSTITDYEVLCQKTYSQLCDWASVHNESEIPKIPESTLLVF